MGSFCSLSHNMYNEIYSIMASAIYGNTLDEYATLVCTQISTLLCALAIATPVIIILLIIRKVLDI